MLPFPQLSRHILNNLLFRNVAQYMKRILLSLALLLTGTACAWDYQSDATPLPLPPGYQKPATGESPSLFNRKARPPYWDAGARCLVVECCMPPMCRNGVSHFYTFVYTISADGKSVTRTERMWNSHKTDEEPKAYTSTMTTDTPYHFDKGRKRYIITVDAQGAIISIMEHGTDVLTGTDLPPDGRVVYPMHKAPGIVHYVF